jgi:hypothetical protein
MSRGMLDKRCHHVHVRPCCIVARSGTMPLSLRVPTSLATHLSETRNVSVLTTSSTKTKQRVAVGNSSDSYIVFSIDFSGFWSNFLIVDKYFRPHLTHCCLLPVAPRYPSLSNSNNPYPILLSCASASRRPSLLPYCMVQRGRSGR